MNALSDIFIKDLPFPVWRAIFTDSFIGLECRDAERLAVTFYVLKQKTNGFEVQKLLLPETLGWWTKMEGFFADVILLSAIDPTARPLPTPKGIFAFDKITGALRWQAADFNFLAGNKDLLLLRGAENGVFLQVNPKDGLPIGVLSETEGVEAYKRLTEELETARNQDLTFSQILLPEEPDWQTAKTEIATWIQKNAVHEIETATGEGWQAWAFYFEEEGQTRNAILIANQSGKIHFDLLNETCELRADGHFTVFQKHLFYLKNKTRWVCVSLP